MGNKMQIGSLPVGSKINVGNVFYILVHHGYNGGDNSVLMRESIIYNTKWSERNTDSYRNSSLNNYLQNSYFNSIPAKVRYKLQTVRIESFFKPSYSDGRSDDFDTRIFVPSATEVGIGPDSGDNPQEGSKFEYFSNDSTAKERRKATLSGYPDRYEDWWLRTPVKKSPSGEFVYIIDQDGDKYKLRHKSADIVFNDCYVRPVFVVPSTLVVEDYFGWYATDGDALPEVPQNLSLYNTTSRINTNEGRKDFAVINLRWDRANELTEDSEVVRYAVERCRTTSDTPDASWEIINTLAAPVQSASSTTIQGGLTENGYSVNVSYNDNLPLNYNLFFRVRAYDDVYVLQDYNEGLLTEPSNYVKVEVVNNKRPTMDWFIVESEATKHSGDDLKLMWSTAVDPNESSPAVDPDGSFEKYILERKNFDDTYTVVYEGNDATQYVDVAQSVENPNGYPWSGEIGVPTILEYRVTAKDTAGGYSNYLTKTITLYPDVNLSASIVDGSATDTRYIGFDENISFEQSAALKIKVSRTDKPWADVDEVKSCQLKITYDADKDLVSSLGGYESENLTITIGGTDNKDAFFEWALTKKQQAMLLYNGSHNIKVLPVMNNLRAQEITLSIIQNCKGCEIITNSVEVPGDVTSARFTIYGKFPEGGHVEIAYDIDDAESWTTIYDDEPQDVSYDINASETIISGKFPIELFEGNTYRMRLIASSEGADTNGYVSYFAGSVGQESYEEWMSKLSEVYDWYEQHKNDFNS